MTQDEIDTMWQQAMKESIKDGEMFTRYHFAKLVAEKEREACAKVADGWPDYDVQGLAEAIRARGEQA
jgi:hypothetical protein